MRENQLSAQKRPDDGGSRMGTGRTPPQGGPGLTKAQTRFSCHEINTRKTKPGDKYSCTDVEKQVLRDKMTYNGMTVMKTTTIEEFMGIRPIASTFVKGQVIRLLGFNEDSHMANAIYEEINKGVYI